MLRYTFFRYEEDGSDTQVTVEAESFGRAYCEAHCGGCIDCILDEDEEEEACDIADIPHERLTAWAVCQISDNSSRFSDDGPVLGDLTRCYVHGMTVYDMYDKDSMVEFFKHYE